MTEIDEDLERSTAFKSMPSAMQEWIRSSPHASDSFAEFFRDGGSFNSEGPAKKPYYRAEPLEVVVDDEQWRQLQKNDANPYTARHMFVTMAHEIGHHNYNTGKNLFPGGSQEDYVHYRSDLEANAIFNAFPIIRDLQQSGDPNFKDTPLGSVGYLADIQLAPAWSAWSKGQIDDKAAVQMISPHVANTSYTLNHPPVPPDLNGDGRVTHRDAFIRDYQQLIKARPEMARRPEERELEGSIDNSLPSNPGARILNPADNSHPDHAMLLAIRDGMGKIDEQVGKPFDDKSEQLCRALLANCRDTSEQAQNVPGFPHSQAANALHKVDHVVMSKDGSTLFAVEGALSDPAHKLVSVDVAQAINTPVAQSDAKLDAANVTITQELERARQQTLAQTPDDPSRGGPAR